MAAVAGLNSGDMAWMLTSTALVQLMTPGLAFFYGGLVPSGSVVNTLMLVCGTMGVVTILWALIGYSLAFGPNINTGVLGDTSLGVMNFGDQLRMLPGLPDGANSTTITEHIFMAYQLMFAIITAAIIAGSVVQKIKYWWWLLFIAMWHIFVYCPLAHYVFFSNGWLFQYGAIDFAGGLVVHTASGISAFVLTFWLGKAHAEAPLPHNVPYVLLGGAMLWFGWFGFNAGSALAANALAGRAFVNTQFAAAAAMFSWNVYETLFPSPAKVAEELTRSERRYVDPASLTWLQIIGQGRPTVVGTACGMVTGLVTITPACGYVSTMWSIFIGAFGSLVVIFTPAIARRLTGVDDRLDCFAFHGMGGITGALLTGLFATVSANPGGVDGAFYKNAPLYGKEIAAILVTVAFAVIGTSIIYWVLWGLAKAMGTEITIPRDLQANVDASQHGEKAYAYSEMARHAAAGAETADVTKKVAAVRAEAPTGTPPSEVELTAAQASAPPRVAPEEAGPAAV